MFGSASVLDEPRLTYNPHRVILLPTHVIDRRLLHFIHEEEEWATGVPASMTVCDAFMRELFCRQWNYPESKGVVLKPGDLLVPQWTEMEVCFLNGRSRSTIHFVEDEVLTVTEVGHDSLMDQYVFRSTGSKARNYLPVDWEMFRHLN